MPVILAVVPFLTTSTVRFSFAFLPTVAPGTVVFKSSWSLTVTRFFKSSCVTVVPATYTLFSEPVFAVIAGFSLIASAFTQFLAAGGSFPPSAYLTNN